MLKNFFSELSGFDSEIIKKLNPSSARNLELTSFWCLLGIVCASFSAAYLFYFSLNSAILASLVFLIVFFLLLALQIILITGTTGNAQINEKEFEVHATNQYQYILFIFLSIVLTQPLLIFLFNVIKPEGVKNQLSQINLLDKSYYKNNKEKNKKELQSDLAQYEDYLKQIAASNQLPTFKNKDGNSKDFASNIRKALIIGNQNYKSSPLNNPKKDAVDMSKKLESMGFSVQSVLDGDYFAIESAIRNYTNLLMPGDISFIYYSGHGFQDHGINYLVPIDFQETNDRSKAISLNVLIESISLHYPAASIFVIDACRNGMGRSQGLASIEAGQNTYIALAAEPGKFSFDDKPGSNGFFTKAILENINADVDIDKIFRRVREQVQHQTKNNQITWTTHNLNSDLILIAPKDETSEFIKNINLADRTGIPCGEINQNNYGPDDKLKLQTCIFARYLKVRDDLTDLNQSNLFNLKKDESNDSKDLLDAYSLLIKNYPISFILGMILITIFMSGGFILRQRLRKEFYAYEVLFHSKQRNIVIDHAKKYLSKAEKLPYGDKNFILNAFTLTPNEDRDINTKILKGKTAIEALLKKYKKKQ